MPISICPPKKRRRRDSAHDLAEFTFACRKYLPKITVEADREKARELVAKLTGATPIKVPVAIK